MLGEQLRKFRVEVWAYCLMPNHVHLIVRVRQGLEECSYEKVVDLSYTE
jgi:REP element-mobilizing transposase RayT